MPAPSRPPFTEADDALMLELRAAGQGWREVGQRLGRCHVTCLRRWDKIGGGRQLRQMRAMQPPEPVLEVDTWLSSPDRSPLPVGHPISWGAIVLPSASHS